MASKNRAPFITVEGVDGAGKSSHIPVIVEELKEAGFDVVETNEPGGTKLGFVLRKEILNTEMSVDTEVLLAFASRKENIDNIIRPALVSGSAVVCDRFTDSTYAYQMAGGGADRKLLDFMSTAIQKGLEPDLTLLFDLPCEISMSRLSGKDKDKFEVRPIEYFESVRKGYEDRVNANPLRFAVIDSTPSLEEVKEQVRVRLAEFLASWEPAPTPKSNPKP